MATQRAGVQTYHCLCTTLILTSPYNIEQLPTRRGPADQAHILPFSGSSDNVLESRLQNVTSDRRPMIVKRDDGFEKRLFMRCDRCRLLLGYRLGDNDDAPNVVYLLPGGLTSTGQMQEEGRSPP
jgi:hypothetical protein